MANRQKQPILDVLCSLKSQARPEPSYVDVPQPSSAIMINEFYVAELDREISEDKSGV